MTCNKEKTTQWIETDTDVTQMLELVDKDTKTIMTVLHMFTKIKEKN